MTIHAGMKSLDKTISTLHHSRNYPLTTSTQRRHGLDRITIPLYHIGRQQHHSPLTIASAIHTGASRSQPFCSSSPSWADGLVTRTSPIHSLQATHHSPTQT